MWYGPLGTSPAPLPFVKELLVQSRFHSTYISNWHAGRIVNEQRLVG
jgi:hypothetical protein